MKRSDLNKFIKENIIETLTEGASTEEKRIAMRAIKSIAKYRGVSEDEARNDRIRAAKEIGNLNEEAIPEKNITLADALERYSFGELLDTAEEFYRSEGENDIADMAAQAARNFRKALDDFDGGIAEQLPSKEEVEDTTAAVQALKKELDDLKEDDDIDDKDAVAQANKARGKHKKLDIAVKALKDISTEMKSLARKYSAADDVEKEKIKDDLKAKTAKKKELESLVDKLEKDVV